MCVPGSTTWHAHSPPLFFGARYTVCDSVIGLKIQCVGFEGIPSAFSWFCANRKNEDTSLRVIIDEVLVCGEAVWKVYERAVDESWFFAGWTAPGVKALVSVLRIGPDTLDR